MKRVSDRWRTNGNDVVTPDVTKVRSQSDSGPTEVADTLHNPVQS
jgi:hypothetical protein